MKIILSIFLALTALLWFAPDTHNEEAKTLYTCGMHPQIIQDHPGNCPICGMKLTPIRRGVDAETNAADASAIAVDAATQQDMNIRTAVIHRGPLRKTIRTVGAIDYNETALADVTTKFKGWIEKLDVDATGQLVHRGEPMFEIYSPELYSAEAEFLLALDSGSTNDPGVAALRETAAQKLKFFDVPDAQIAELEKSRIALKTLPVAAPMSGFVIEKNVVAGQMVDAGMRLYRLADLGIVWVIAQVYEQDLAFVQLGQEAVVKVASLPDREFRGRVTFVYPTVDEKTRTARVRLEFENPGYYLKPGMFVSAEIHAELADSAVLVPDSAVLRSGAQSTVFVALAGGKFEARDMVLGVEAEDDLIQVTSGLSAGERVVTSGQFLLDSESQLREAIEKMRGSTAAAKTEAAGVNSTNEAAATALPAKAEAEATVYVCPMPEHVSIIYDHAGNCPICGMVLVPVTPSELKKIQPGGKVLYYTCPMPEHAGVHEDKPGKCPLCGMTLIPVMARPEPVRQSTIPTIQNPAQIPPPANTNSPSAAKPEAKQLYTCPMHPEVVADQPGKCPRCEMDLVPVKSK
jgi:multidrug efflux pump subunit AcrA (membrane-fusion protein)